MRERELAVLTEAAEENMCAFCPSGVVEIIPEMSIAICCGCDACVTLLDEAQYHAALAATPT